MESLRQRHAMRYRERNIRCKLYPLSSILVLSGTHPVIQQMSSTTTEILITIRFASIPQNIHMDMIYTPPSPSPSKLYIYHFRLRLRRYIMSYSPPGTSRGQILWHNYFHCQSVAIFLRNYVCFLYIFFSVAVHIKHQGSIKARHRKSSDCNIKQYWVPTSSKWTLFIFIETRPN